MIKNLKNILVNIYYKRLPKGVLKIIGPFVEAVYSVVNRLFSIVSDISIPVTLSNEKVNSDSSNLNLLIAGRGDVFPFLLDRMYNAELRTTRQDKRLIWRVPSINRLKVSAVMIEADRCFSRFLSARGFIPIPEWILFTMDISMPIEDIIKRYKKHDWGNYRKIKKYQYTYEVEHDWNKLHFFYHRMYLPYIKSRYGKLAHLASFAYIENLMRNSELLLVKLDDEYVSGLVINTASSIPILAFMGIKDGRKDYIRQGAGSAIYYFSIFWAKKMGYTKLDCGHCRPFLNDGVLQYKKRLGMHIHRSPRKHRMLYLSFGRPNIYLKQFFINNPLIYEDQGQLKGLLFLDSDVVYSKQTIEALKKKYFIPGLNDFSVISYNTPLLKKSKQRSKKRD